ncbi:MAG: 4-alpha-glucanotransferase [Candidatus Gastranaerophilaceae bacterium]
MLVNSILQTIPFGRKLTATEEKDYTQNALKPAFEYLGTEEVAMIIHGTCFPENNFDIGVGSPYSQEALNLLKFEKVHGFNSNQLGPVGVIRDANNISPYQSTIFTKNYLFTDIKELSQDKYANIVPEEVIKILFNKPQKEHNYAYSDFPEAFANYQYIMKIANKNFKKKLEENNPTAIELNKEFEIFKQNKRNDIYKDALYDVLSKTYKTSDFNKWNDIDRNLIKELNDKNLEAIERYKKIIYRNKEDFESYIFGQFILDKQIKENTQERQKLGFKYINDLLVGFSESDEWANQDLFLKDYRMGCPYGGKGGGPQAWNIPVLDPKKLFNPDGSLGDAGQYLKRKLEASLENFDNIRIDHALGLIDPYIYNKYSLVALDGVIDRNRLKANNISNMPSIDPDGNYKKILNRIILPTLKEHSINKNYPVWEDLCAATQTFDNIYHEQNNLPGITQLQFMRGETSYHHRNWGLVGSHDFEPAQEMIKKDWIKNHNAWNIFYLAGYLNSNPARAKYRDKFCKKIDENESERVKAKFAELFLSCKKIQISFADFFGIDKSYNVGGVANNDNWKLRLNNDYEDSYYKNLASKNPTALNLPEILKMAVQGKADMNKVEQAKKHNIPTEEISSENPQYVQDIINKLDKYEKILKE